jgi:hypothetical protein
MHPCLGYDEHGLEAAQMLALLDSDNDGPGNENSRGSRVRCNTALQ